MTGMYDQFEVYGVKFIRVKEEHLEQVRTWRNSDFVRSRMLYQEIITPEMQLKWFHTVNNEANYYFIAEYMGKPAAVINVKDIKDKIGEPGIYLVEEDWQNTSVASLISVAFGEFLFGMLKLEKLYLHVRKDNEEALKFNLWAGYKIIDGKSGADFYYLELDKAAVDNNARTNKLKKFLNKKQTL